MYIVIWKAYCKRRDVKTGGGGFVVLPFPFNTLLPFCWRKYKFRFCFGTGTLLWRWKCSIGELERGKRDVKCILGKFLLTIFTSAFEIIAEVWEITKLVSIHGTLIVRLDLQHNLFWKANFKWAKTKTARAIGSAAQSVLKSQFQIGQKQKLQSWFNPIVTTYPSPMWGLHWSPVDLKTKWISLVYSYFQSWFTSI